MSRFVFVSLLLLAGAGISAVAQVQTSQPAVSDHTAATAAHPTPGPKPGDRNCIRDTGSLIPPKKGECLPVAGRSYSQQDIQRTGQTTLGPALRDLDPSISVRGR